LYPPMKEQFFLFKEEEHTPLLFNSKSLKVVLKKQLVRVASLVRVCKKEI
jgi:hypothetical protein